MWRLKNDPKFLCYADYLLIGGYDNMHNLLSHNQLADWKTSEDQEVQKTKDLELINDYFDCLVDCESDHSDKRICRDTLKKS